MQHALVQKPYKGMGMEGPVAKWYTSLTARAADDFKALAQRVAGEVPPGSDILEVAPGPGYFVIEVAKLGAYRISAIDISHTFVKIAREKARQAGVGIDFRQGDVAHMPFADESFDFLLCRAAFKNFSQPVQALEEMYRVLKPGGRALIIDLRKDAPPESVSAAVDGMHLGRVNRFITKLTFRRMLLQRAYTRGEFEQFLSQTRFGPIDIQQSLTGLELTLQRHGAA